LVNTSGEDWCGAYKGLSVVICRTLSADEVGEFLDDDKYDKELSKWIRFCLSRIDKIKKRDD